LGLQARGYVGLHTAVHRVERIAAADSRRAGANAAVVNTATGTTPRMSSRAAPATSHCGLRLLVLLEQVLVGVVVGLLLLLRVCVVAAHDGVTTVVQVVGMGATTWVHRVPYAAAVVVGTHHMVPSAAKRSSMMMGVRVEATTVVVHLVHRVCVVVVLLPGG
jgi:hypothetical protein